MVRGEEVVGASFDVGDAVGSAVGGEDGDVSKRGSDRMLVAQRPTKK